MKRREVNSGIYKALSNVISSGNKEEIKQAKANYWKEYKRQWKRIYRQNNTEQVISLTKKELNQVKCEAKRYRKSRAQFIKTCLFAYLNQRYVVPNEIEVRRISQSIALMYHYIQDLMEVSQVNSDVGRIILEKIDSLNAEVHVALHHPKLVEEVVSEIIKSNPEAKQRLINLLTLNNNDDH